MKVNEVVKLFEEQHSEEVVIRATRLAALLSKNYMDEMTNRKMTASCAIEATYHEEEDSTFLLVTVRSTQFLQLPEDERTATAVRIYDATREELRDFGELPVFTMFAKLSS